MEAVGPAVSIPVSILETFKLFFTAALVTTMVEQTNLYAAQVLGDQTQTAWTNVTEGDIYAFLGIAILMGVNQLPALAHYWQKDPIFHYSPIADRISRDRFLAIWRFLHFADNTTQPDRSDPEYDRLFKVRPVISAVNRACQQNYHGSQHRSIDEAMVGFKGRCSMKQYMPKKPIKRGFKIWFGQTVPMGMSANFNATQGKKGTPQKWV